VSALDSLDIDAIVARMPHRYPGVLVDRLTSLVPGERIAAIKNVTMNEPYFQGHFPGYPVMPGVLILEALTQLAGVLAVASGLVDADGAPAVSFDGIDRCRFKRQVVPGDQLVLECAWQAGEGEKGRFEVRALVDGQLAAEASLLCAVAVR
jgi:3-hydroxyacyl-[acyl-carrier-protein] dehydratase